MASLLLGMLAAPAIPPRDGAGGSTCLHHLRQVQAAETMQAVDASRSDAGDRQEGVVSQSAGSPASTTPG
jgi:hypothetical protein